VDRDEAAPLIGRNLQEFDRAVPTIRSDCAWADPGVVDEDIDAAEPGSRGADDLIGRGVTGQVGLDGEEIVPLSLLTGAAANASKGSRSRSTPATRIPAASRPCVMALPMPPAAAVPIATRSITFMAYFLPLNC
jgi:hypothetical protein